MNAVKFLKIMVADFLKGNKGATPDIQLFGTVIVACRRKGTITDARLVESVISLMWSLHESGLYGCRPKSWTYKTAIFIYKELGETERAEELMWEAAKKLDKKHTKQLFQTVLYAWHDSHHPDKHFHIQKLRLEMKRRLEAAQKTTEFVHVGWK
jgi:hypothetical protein